MAAGDVTATITSGTAKRAAHFDGTADYIEIDDSLTLLGSTTKGTIAFWAKPKDSTPAAIERILAFGDTNANERLEIILQTDGTLRAVCVAGAVGQWDVDTDAVAFASNTWVHIAATQDAVSPVLYVNGVAVASTFTDSGDTTAWFSQLAGLDNGRIGCNNFNSAGNASFTDGSVKDVLLYNRDLSAAEILSIAQSAPPTTDGLIHRYELTTDFTDSVGSADGTSVGATLVVDDGAIADAIAGQYVNNNSNYAIAAINGQVICAAIEEL